MTIFEQVAAVFTALFLLVVLSYYLLLFLPKKKLPIKRIFSSITVIIPAHNEGPYLKEAIDSVRQALFEGTKQIIVIDDGSIDDTSGIAKQYKDVMLLQQEQKGKSASINRALKEATGELIAIVDGDSVISKNSLIEMAKELGRD
ncbi:MAG: glycosyltransferase family 2 protein, partial [Nanoarchaeota archaeon]